MEEVKGFIRTARAVALKDAGMPYFKTRAGDQSIEFYIRAVPNGCDKFEERDDVTKFRTKLRSLRS